MVDVRPPLPGVPSRGSPACPNPCGCVAGRLEPPALGAFTFCHWPFPWNCCHWPAWRRNTCGFAAVAPLVALGAVHSRDEVPPTRGIEDPAWVTAGGAPVLIVCC